MDAPVVLILAPAEVVALPAITVGLTTLDTTPAAARGERRRRVLAALAGSALIRQPGRAPGLGFRPFAARSRASPGPDHVRADGHGEGGRRLAGTPLFASVAERDGWAAAALAPWPVGVDVESVAGAGAAADTVLAGVDAADPAAWHGLAGLWAAREAVLKAVGRDLTCDPGGWRFAAAMASAREIAPHRVDLLDLGPVVAAVAYAGA